jgi:hypothetical protein
VVLKRRRRYVPEGIPDTIDGQAPDGSLVRVELSSGRRVLLFMTSSCAPCLDVWPTLTRGQGLVVITPSASTENRRKLARLAPPGVLVVMSSPAWFAFAPGPAPWRVVLQDGAVVESGQAGP